MSGKTFKDYYQDPEFRKRHKAYILTKVECPCGATTARCNMTRHKKSSKHQLWESKQVSVTKLTKLENKIKELEKLLKEKNNQINASESKKTKTNTKTSGSKTSKSSKDH